MVESNQVLQKILSTIDCSVIDTIYSQHNFFLMINSARGAQVTNGNPERKDEGHARNFMVDHYISIADDELHARCFRDVHKGPLGELTSSNGQMM